MLTFESEAIVVLIIYIGPPKVFFFFGPLPKKFAHHCSKRCGGTGFLYTQSCSCTKEQTPNTTVMNNEAGGNASVLQESCVKRGGTSSGP
jgi:hypothetical protein